MDENQKTNFSKNSFLGRLQELEDSAKSKVFWAASIVGGLLVFFLWSFYFDAAVISELKTQSGLAENRPAPTQSFSFAQTMQAGSAEISRQAGGLIGRLTGWFASPKQYEIPAKQ